MRLTRYGRERSISICESTAQRARAMHPCPIPYSEDDKEMRETIYSLLIPEVGDVLRSAAELVYTGNMNPEVYTNTSMVRFSAATNERPNRRIEIRTERYLWGINLDTGRHGFPPVSFSAPNYQEIRDWVETAWAFELRLRKAVRFFKDIFETCNTPGQLRRVFPECAPVLGEEMQQWIATAKARSPWPEKLDKDYAMQARTDAAYLLTMGMMLPNDTKIKIWVGD